MAEPGAVGWQFTRRGVIVLDRGRGRRGRADDGGARGRRRRRRRRRRHVAGHVRPERHVTTSRRRSKPPGTRSMSADTPMVSDNLVPVDQSSRTPRRSCGSWTRIEDNDDVQDVYSNFDITDDDDGSGGRMSVGVGDRAPTSRCPAPVERRTRCPTSLGKPVVLVFYPGDDTPVCTKQLNAYNDGLEQFAELDAQIIGISAQDVDSHDAFSAKHGFEFPLLADVDKEVAAAYGTLGPIGFPRRSVFIIDRGRHHPVRPPGDRRADVPPGQRAGRRARSARLTLVSAVGVRCPGTASDRSPRTAHRRRRCATRPPG